MGAALAGDYRLLVPVLARLEVGTLFLELCTPRAGEIEVLRELPRTCRVGVGVANQKHERVEAVEEIVGKARRAVDLFGPERVLLTPDCGFATFADNPVASPGSQRRSSPSLRARRRFSGAGRAARERRLARGRTVVYDRRADETGVFA